jgi:hypothetical protein
MSPHIIEARYVGHHVIWLRFQDGICGTVDLRGELWGPVFTPLQDIENFRRFQVHHEFHTLVWYTGADFAPEFLRQKLLFSSGAGGALK